MTQNISRRSILSLPLAVLPIGISFQLGCLNSTQANNLNVWLSTIVAGIQTLLPVVETFTPPPIGIYLSLAGGFLNTLNTFVTTIISESATMDSASVKAQTILSAAAMLLLSPDVISHLPASFTTPAGVTIQTSAEIQSLANLANSIIKLFAGMVKGATTSVQPNNVILSINVPSMAAAAKVVATVNATAASAAMAPVMMTATSNAIRLSSAMMIKK